MSNFKLQCPIQGHKQNYIQWICLCQSCFIENQAICQDCLNFHHQHYSELIQMDNLDSVIKELRNQIQLKLSIINNEKERVLGIIQKMMKIIENNIEECQQPLQDLNDMLRITTQTDQKHNMEELRKLVWKLRANCIVDTQKDQKSEFFIGLKKEFIDSTFGRCLEYCENVERRLNLMNSQNLQVPISSKLKLETPITINQVTQNLPKQFEQVEQKILQTASLRSSQQIGIQPKIIAVVKKD